MQIQTNKSRRLTLARASVSAAALATMLSGAVQADELAVQIQAGNPPEMFQGFAKLFNEKYPDTKVIFQSMSGPQIGGANLAVLGSSNPPDLGLIPINATVYTELLRANALEPMTDLYAEADLDNRISPSISASFKRDGVPYVAPYTSVIYSVAFANKDIFEAAGIPFPEDHRIPSVDTLIEWSAKFKEAGYQTFTVGGGSNHQTTWLLDAMLPTVLTDEQHAALIASADPSVEITTKFSDPEFVQVLTDLKRMYDADVFQPGFLSANGDQAATNFHVGKAALAIGGSFSVVGMKKAPEVKNLDWLMPPASGTVNKSRLSLYYGDTLGIPVNSKNKEMAKEFMKIVLDNDAQAEYLVKLNYLPSVETLTAEQMDSLDPMNKELLADIAAEGGVVGYTSAVPGPIGSQFLEPLIQKMFLGEMTPQEVGDAAQENLMKFREEQ